jgi:hypothetical protein
MISYRTTRRPMKLCGVQLQMVLVLAVVCIIMYVFYISKDIVHVEKEMRILRHDVDTLNMKLKQMARHQSKPPAFMAAQVLVPNIPSTAVFGVDDDVSIGSKIGIEGKDDVVVEAVASEDSGEADDVAADVVDLAALAAADDQDDDVPPPTKPPPPSRDIASLSWAELKERCKQRNIPIKGCTKEQLIAKLGES